MPATLTRSARGKYASVGSPHLDLSDTGYRQAERWRLAMYNQRKKMDRYTRIRLRVRICLQWRKLYGGLPTADVLDWIMPLDVTTACIRGGLQEPAPDDSAPDLEYGFRD